MCLIKEHKPESTKKTKKKERDKRKRKVCNPQCWNTWITLFIAGQVSETHTSWRSHILLYPRAGGVVNVAVFQPDRKHCVYVLIIWKAWARGPSSHTDSFLIRPRLPVRKKKTKKKPCNTFPEAINTLHFQVVMYESNQ